VAKSRRPQTLLEWNLLYAMGSLMTEGQRLQGGMSLLDQGRLMVKAMPKATRVGEFVAMWTIAKYENGAVTVDELASFWNEPVRTMYRRLAEFRDVWGPAGYESPDKIADALIADYRKRHERLGAAHVGRLLSARIAAPLAPPSVVRGS
jgi:hypothetical protein